MVGLQAHPTATSLCELLMLQWSFSTARLTIYVTLHSGARKGLYIVDLQNPYDPPRFLPHHSPWDVADVQWNPFPARSEWVVSTVRSL